MPGEVKLALYSTFMPPSFAIGRGLSLRRSQPDLRVIFSENRDSEDSHEKSIFLLFRLNKPLSELIQGKIV